MPLTDPTADTRPDLREWLLTDGILDCLGPVLGPENGDVSHSYLDGGDDYRWIQLSPALDRDGVPVDAVALTAGAVTTT